MAILSDDQFKNLFEEKGAAATADVPGLPHQQGADPGLPALQRPIPPSQGGGGSDHGATPPSAEGPGKGAKPASTPLPKGAVLDGGDFDKMFGPNATPLDEGKSGQHQDYDPSQFNFQPKLGQNNELLRAQNQGFFEQLGKTVGNTIANIPLDLVQAIGYTGELLDSSHDYTNPLIDVTENMKNPFGEVYREHPDKVFDLADSAWWLNNIGGFVEGTAQFIIPGEAEAAGMGALAKAASTGLKMSKAATEAIMGVGHVLSTSHLAYLMAASSGRQVYNESYDTNYHRLLRQGLDAYTASEQAKQISSNAAAATVQLSTALNTVFGMAALAPMFRTSENKVMNWLETKGARQEGESLEAWKQRLNNAVSDKDLQAAMKTRGGVLSLTGYPAQAMQIGVQGINNEYAEKAGKEVAEGKARGNIDAISDYFDKVTDQQGALNFLIGMVGGPVHALLMDHIPVHRVIKYDSDGKPQYKKDPNLVGDDANPQYLTQRVSARTRDQLGNQQFFNNVKDAMNKDVDWYRQKNSDLDKATKENRYLDAEMLRQEMFGVNNLNAVAMGLGDNWKKEYQDIANLDNHKDMGQSLQPRIDQVQQEVDALKAQGASASQMEAAEIELGNLRKNQKDWTGKTDAMMKGFSRGVEDNEYKDRARRSIENLDWMKKTYDNIRSKYFSPTDPHSEELSYHLFAKEAELHLMKQTLDDERQSISRDQGILEPMQTYREQMKVSDETAKRLEKDKEDLYHYMNTNNMEALRELAGRYGVPAYEDHEIGKSIKGTFHKMQDEIERHNADTEAAEQNLKDNTGFSKWLAANEGKNFGDFLGAIGRQRPVDDRIAERKAHLEAMESQWKIKKDNLDEVKSSKGIMEFNKNMKKSMDTWKKEQEAKNLKDNVNAFLHQQDKVAAERIKRVQLQGEKGKIEQRILHTIEQENQAKKDIQNLRDQIAKTTYRQPVRLLALKQKARLKEAELARLQKTRSSDIERVQQLSNAIQETAMQEMNKESLTRDEVQNNTAPEPAQGVQANEPITSDRAPIPDDHTATTNSEPAKEDQAIKDYLGLKDQLSGAGAIHGAIDNLELIQDPHTYSIDMARNALEPFVEDGTISEDFAHQIIVAQKAYLEHHAIEAENASIPRMDLEPTPLPQELMPPVEALTADDVTGPEEPFSPVLNMSPTAMATPEEAMRIDQHLGAKVMDSMKINVAAIEYVPVVKEIKGRAVHLFLPEYTKLDPAFNKNILKPGFISSGDEIKFVVDKDWVGRINYDKSLEVDDYGKEMKRRDQFSNYTDENSKIRMSGEGGYDYSNVPIKIVHSKSGETVGYLPRTDWITAEYASMGYRNMVDTIVNPDGSVMEGNVEAQKEKLLTARRIISLAHNKGEGQEVKSTVSPRESGGHVFLNNEVNRNMGTSKLKPLTGKTLLPDKSLRFAIMNGTEVYTGYRTPLDGPRNFTAEDMARYGKPGVAANNIPMVVLPMPNNKSSVSPLYTRALSERPADIHTITRAIEAHLAAGTEHDNDRYRKVRAKILEATNAGGGGKALDITDPRNLESFINQYYTYTRHFRDTDTAMDAKVMEGGSKQPQFMLDIAKEAIAGNRPEIKAGTSWSGMPPVRASIDPATGKLNAPFEEALKEGLATHYKNVVYTRDDIRGINDSKPFHSITIGQDNIPKITKHDNYNEYLKTFADTIVYGKHQAEDGTYLYGANPVTNFDFNQIASTKIGAAEEAPKANELTIDEDDIFSSMINGNPHVEGSEESIGTNANPTPPDSNTRGLEDLIKADSPKKVSIENIAANIGKLYDEASANPDQRYNLDLLGDPKAKIRLGDKSTITMTKLASMLDERPIPYNIRLSDDFMSILQNTPKRFLNSLSFEDSSMFAPLPYSQEILGKQIKEMFVPVRDADGKDTGVFEAEKQTDIVDNVVQAIKVIMDSGKAGNLTVEGYKDTVKNNVFRMMRDKYQTIAEGGTMKGMESVTPDQATNLVREYDKVLRSFDTPGLNFWSLAIDKLKALGINVRDNGQGKSLNVMPKLTADGMDPLSDATFAEGEGHGLLDWSDVSFETDPKETATGRMKMFLATIPDSKVGSEELPREVKLSFTDPKLRQRIVNGQKLFTSRTPDQVQQMGLKLGQDVVTKVDSKLMRISPMKTMDETDLQVHESIATEEGTQPQEGDMLLRMSPYTPKDNVLSSNKNYLGLSKLADYEQLFESVLSKLADKPRDFDLYVQTLREEGNQYNPNLRALAERLSNAPTEIKNEFVSVVSLQYQPFAMVLLDNRKNFNGTNEYVLKTIDANRGSQINTIVDTWQQNQKFAPILKKNKAGITVVDNDKANELKTELTRVNDLYSKLDSTAQQAAVDLMKKTFEWNGIVLPDKALESFINNTDRWTKKTSVAGNFRRQFMLDKEGKPLGVLSSMIQKLSGQESINDDMDEMEDKSYMLTNPLYTEKSSISVLARVAAAHTAQLYSNTHTSSEGKNIYDYGFNNSLSRQVQRIKADDTFRSKFNDVDVAKKSWLLDHLNNSPELRERFTLNYLDGIKVSYMPGASGVTRPDMSDREQHLTSIGMFQNQGDPKYAHYLSLTHSDKTTTPVLRNGPRLGSVTVARMENDKFSGAPKAKMMISEEAMNKLHDVFHSEYDRIMRASQVKDYNNPKYEQGAKYFYFLPQMNYEEMKRAVADGKIPQKVFEKIWVGGNEQLNVKEAPGFKDATQYMLTRHVDDMTNNTLQEWKKNGVVNDKETPFNKKYLDRLLSWVSIYGRKEGDKTIYRDRNEMAVDPEIIPQLTAQLAARDYAVNHYLMNTSMSQLFYGDPAQVWKGSVEKTMVEYGKRLAKDIAPGRELAFKPGETFMTITAKDYKTSAPYLAEIESLKKAYAEGHPLESTDAQELTSTQEHIDVLYAAGRISDKVYTDMSKIIKDADGGYYEFTDPFHKAVILQAQKPVYVGDRAPLNGAILNDYVKSSSYPLYPPFTTGKELDKVRTMMEKQGVARLNFESAHKIGVPTSPVDLFDSQGRVNAKGDWEAAQQVMSRDNFRIQQEVPYDEDKDSIRTVSQMNKLIAQGLPLIKTPFSLDGREVSASELINRKEEIRKQLFHINQTKMLDELGATIDPETGDTYLKDKTKLFDTLQKRALEGNLGFTANDLAYLQETNRLPDSDELIIPLMYAPSSAKFEAMLMSVVGDIGNIKMPGKSYIQASPVGQQSVKKWEEMGDEEKKNVIWTNGYTGEALKTVRIDKETGKVLPAQIIAPFNFQVNGKAVSIDKYIITGEDGRRTLDPEKVPPELLQLVGARIPNQGHNSMLPIEIVGFVPPNMGDLIIVPAAITKQMGSDFDVDKLYTYRRGYTHEGDKFSVIHPISDDAEGHLKNQYFDTHWSVLTHPEMVSKILNLLDKEDLKQEAALISKWEEKQSTFKPTYYDPQYQLRDFQAQKDAKRLVGLSSLSTTFNAVIQDKNIRPGVLAMGDKSTMEEQVVPIRIIDEHGQQRTLSTLSGYGQSRYHDGVANDKDGQLRSKHDNHTTVQSEVLDYAKNKISDKVHLSTATYPASAALTQLQEPDGASGETSSKLIGENNRGWAAHLGYNARLLSQPIIQEYVAEMSKRGDSLSGEYSADLKGAVIQALTEKYLAQAEKEPELANDHTVSYVDLTNSLRTPGSVESYSRKQVEALNLFQQLDQIGTAMMRAQSTINHDTNGAGSTLLDTLSKDRTRAQVSNSSGKEGDIQLLGADSLYVRPEGEGMTEQGTLYKMVHDAAKGIVGELYPYEKMMPIFQYIMEHTNRQDLTIDSQKNVFNAVKSFIFSHPQLGFWDNPEVTRANLLYRRGDNPSLADRVHEAKNTWGQNNYFLQRLQTQIEVDNLHPSHLSYQASKASRLDDYENTKAWLDMFLSPQTDHQKLAEDLIRYSYLTGGLQDARSFIKYVPYSYLVGTDFGHKLRELTGNLKGLITNNPTFMEQWFQHNPQFAKSLSPEMNELGSTQEKYPERFSLQPINREGFHDNNPAKGMIVKTTAEAGPAISQYPDYISYRSRDENRWILYKKVGREDFVRIDTLGDKGMDEYSVGEGMKRSLIPENRSRAYDNIQPAYRMVNNNPLTGGRDSLMHEMNIPSKGGYEEMRDVLRNMSIDREVPEHARIVSDMLSQIEQHGPNTTALAQVIAKGSSMVPAFRFRVDHSNVEHANMGQMESFGNVLTLNETALRSKNSLAETINHEMIHAHTAIITTFSENEKYLSTRYNSDQVQWARHIWSEVADKHPEIIKAIKDLEKVRSEAESKLREYVEKKGYNYDARYQNVVRGNKISDDVDRLIYSMASNTEFITGAMTHHPTMRWLNDQASDAAPKGLLSRVADIVKTIMQSLSKAFGYPAAKGSLLESALEKSLNLVMIGKHSYELTPERMHSVDNMDLVNAAPIATPSLKGLDSIIGKLQEQRDEIVNSLTGRLSKEDVADKRAKIDDIETDIKKLEGELSTALIGEIGRKHLGWVESVLKTESPSISQMMTASRVLETWTNLVDLLYDEGTGSNVDPEFAQIFSNATTLRKDITAKMERTLVNTSDNVIGMRDLNSTSLKDIDRMQGLVRGLSSAATSKATQYVATYMETIARHRDEDIVRFVGKMRGLEDKMVDAAGGKQNLPALYGKLLQENKEGTAWGLVQRFHQNWYDFRRMMRNSRTTAIKEIEARNGSPIEKKLAWQNYWKIMNNNAVFADTRLLFDAETGAMRDDATSQRHRAELEKEVGKDTADEVIQEAHERYQKYLEVKQARFEALDGEVAAGERPPEEADRLKDEFTARYSPNVFFNNFKNPIAQFHSLNSDYYVKMAPKRSVNNGEYYDNKFDDIQKDPKLKAIYQEVNSHMQALKESLPVHVQQQLGSNFFPAMAKSLFTDMIDVPAYVKTMGTKMIHDLTASANEEMEADKNYNKIPIRYVTDDRKNLPLNSRSRDIPRVLEGFSMMALHYKHFADAKDYIDMGETILREIDKARSNGAEQMEQNGKMVTVKAGLRNTMDALKYMKDFLMYKKTRGLEGKTDTMLYSPNPIKQFKTAHTVKDLTVERQKIQDQILNGDIDPSDGAEKIKAINEQLAQYEGRRLYGSKLGDKVITINQLKTLSYNPFSGIANMAFGVVSAAIHANGGTDFSWKELGQAYKMMSHSIMKWGSFGAKDTAQAGKILAIMDRLGIIGDVIDSHYGKIQNRERKPGWQKAVNPYNWMRSGDYYMKGLTTVAMMLHEKVNVVEGGEKKGVSLWEALDENGQWNSKRFGENEAWQSEDLTKQKDLDKFRNKAVRVNMIIHGNQDKNSPKLANKYILGRLIGQFRMSWLPEGWYSRFEGEKFDIQLGRNVKGRYATIKELGIMGYAAVTLKQMASLITKVDPYTGVSKLNGKPMSDVDISNMRRNFAELGFIAGLAGTIITLKSLIDPDADDKVKWSLRMLSNQLIRNEQDLRFYASPGVFDAITRNVIPATEVFKDYWKAMKATARVLTDDDYEASKWLLAITHAGIPVPQATLVNKFKTSATKDLDQLQQ